MKTLAPLVYSARVLVFGLLVTAYAFAQPAVQSATSCLVRSNDDFDIRWETGTNDPVVRFQIAYQNTCVYSVECSFIVQVLHVPRDESSSGAATVFNQKAYSAELRPGERTIVSDRLKWGPGTDGSRIPRLSYFDPKRRSDLAKCVAIGGGPPPAGTPIRREEFLSIAGLHYGDGRAKVLQLYGRPETEERGRRDTTLTYYDDGLQIDIDSSGLIDSIRINSAKANDSIRARVGRDPKLTDLYGMPKDIILQRLGRADDVSSDMYEYAFESKAGEGQVTFSCYSFKKYACNEISVNWYYPKRQ
jgi:hypothetical protein